MSVLLTISNSRTEITGADNNLLGILDYELRYPTDVAQVQDAYVEIPELQDMNWDGWVRFLHKPKTKLPWFPTGLLGLVLRLCRKFGYIYSLDDQRVRPSGDVPEPVGRELRDYQVEAVSLGERIGYGVFNLPPRSGKTFLMCELQRRLAVPAVWLAPTDRIVTQTQSVLENYFGKNYSVHLVGSKKAVSCGNYRIVVCTASTASRLPAEFYASRQSVVVDEWHHAASKTYREIFKKCDHIFHRFGMTGTWFRSGADAMAMHALLAEPIYCINSLELLKRGYLVPCKAVFLPVPCSHLRNMPSKQYNAGHGKYGIHEHAMRNQMVAHTAMFLLKKGCKVLVLVGTKRQGYMVQQIVRSFVVKGLQSEFHPVEFVSTDMDRKIQKRVLESFENGESVKILIGTSLLGEGVDLPSTDALVYARGESAEVTLTQSIYRVSTAVPGKRYAIVVDFADRHHRHLLRHSMERLKVYFEEPTFDVSVLKDPQEFPLWLAQQGELCI